jgi:hypothetical protein
MLNNDRNARLQGLKPFSSLGVTAGLKPRPPGSPICAMTSCDYSSSG